MAARHRANSALAAFAALLIGVTMLAGLSPSIAFAETGAQASSPAAKNLTTAASTDLCDAKIAWPRLDAFGAYGWYDYTGKPINYDKLLVLDGKTLTLNVDYTVECYKWYDHGLDSDSPIAVEPIEAGDYNILFTGIGDYSGTFRDNFIIRDFYNLQYAHVMVYDFFARTMPKNFVPEVHVGDYIHKSEYIRLGKDYVIDNYEVYNKKTRKWKRISHFDGNTVGRYRVFISAAKGSKYRGKHIVGGPFEVLDPYDLRNADIKYDRYLTTTGKASKPVNPIKSVTLNGKELEEGRDYQVVYCDYEELASVGKNKVKKLKGVYKKGQYAFCLIPGRGADGAPCEYKQTDKYCFDPNFYLVAANDLQAAHIGLPERIASERKTGKIKVPSFKVTLNGKPCRRAPIK